MHPIAMTINQEDRVAYPTEASDVGYVLLETP